MIMHKLKILPQDIRNFKKRNNEKICRYIANPLQPNSVTSIRSIEGGTDPSLRPPLDPHILS